MHAETFTVNLVGLAPNFLHGRPGYYTKTIRFLLLSM